MRNSLFFLLLAAAVGICSCGRQISPDTYSGEGVGESSVTHAGIIVHARMVNIQDQEYLQDNTMGIIGGGLGGAYLGSKVGKGEGNTLATIGGALIGAAGGALAEQSLKAQPAMEYVVQLDNGETRTVVQGPSPQFAAGQTVYLIVGKKGRSRIIAR